MKKLLVFIGVSLVAQISYAQVSNYDFFAYRLGNMFNVNPAWVTKDDGINVILNAQTLSTPLNYADKNIMAGIYSRVGERSGLGVKTISNTRGAFNIFRSDLSYGYEAKFSERHSLRLGALAGLHNSSLNINRIDNYEMLDLSDPTLSNSYFNTTQFVAGAGIVYSIQNLDVSASFPQIISTSQPFNSYMNTAVFYRIKAGNDLVVQPWVSYENIPVTKNMLGTYVKCTYQDLIWVQAGFQNNRSIQGAFGISFENIGIAYGYRSANSDFRQVGGAVHEVAFTFRIIKGSKKNRIRNPDGSPQTLDDIIKNLDALLNKDVTKENRADLLNELDRIKKMLREAEIDNSDPEKIKLVEQQLILIEEKLRMIEKKLYND
ncbi:MAG: PorP/SprF family type IX secretion system membrane protein [Cytophagaceae bacterium]